MSPIRRRRVRPVQNLIKLSPLFSSLLFSSLPDSTRFEWSGGGTAQRNTLHNDSLSFLHKNLSFAFYWPSKVSSCRVTHTQQTAQVKTEKKKENGQNGHWNKKYATLL